MLVPPALGSTRARPAASKPSSLCWLIERSGDWRAQYDRFAADGDFDTVNREIGRAVKEELGATNIEERQAHGNCMLIKTYTMLRFAED